MAAPAPTAPGKRTYRRYAIHFEQDGQWTKEVAALFALGMPHTEREGWQTSDVDITARGARGHAKSHLTKLKVNIPRVSLTVPFSAKLPSKRNAVFVRA